MANADEGAEVKPRLLSLFSGIGGIDYAFEEAGFAIVEQVEIDDFCRTVLAKHWPAIPRHRDIFDYQGTVGSADVITAGFPCQPFSVAGKQRGKEDERFLWPELYRVICEVRPLVIFLENVPGLRTNDNGRTFKHILRQLAEVGYDAEWGHLQAAHVGAPHRRERIFIVAYASQLLVDGGDNDAGKHLEGIAFSESGNDSRSSSVAYRPHDGRSRGRRARARRSGLADGGQNVDDSEQQRRSIGTPRQTRRTLHDHQGHDTPSQSRWDEQQSRIAGAGSSPTQPRLGRSVDGLSEQLVGHRFPAPPGPQYDWEAPRTAAGVKGRTNQLKALGNAVVPQVVYPVALAIREWLEANA